MKHPRIVKSKIFLCISAGSLLLISSSVHSIVPVGGWGYSLGYAADRIIGVLPADNDVWYWWVDPPSESIESGRVTVFYDTSLFTVVDTGWVGDFALDASIASPPVTGNGVIPTLDPNGQAWELQGSSVGMASYNVILDNIQGIITIEFDWGDTPFVPSTTDHFNFFGIAVEIPDNVTGFEFVTRGTGDFGLLGSPDDVVTNGTNSLTYMSCTSGFCGESPFGDLSVITTVPLPASIWLFGTGAIGLFLAKRKKYNQSTGA